jgi:Icc-related predicted phosphoesterase
MKFIYVTDLHGDERKYQYALDTAKGHSVDLIHLGADLLPKGSSILKVQKKFVNGFLKNFYNDCKQNNIDVLAFFGNDDLYSRKKYFRKYATLLDEQSYEKDGYVFTAYPYVPDYPFGLKTACKIDYPGWEKGERDLSSPVDVNENGFVFIKDLDEYLAKKGTIEGDLKNFKGGPEVIAAIHCPPYGLDLDVCSGGRRVGSKAVHDWIVKEQPLLVLSGHVHESPGVSGIWKTQVGKTIVIQPGQLYAGVAYVLIDVEKEVKVYLITKG